MYIRNTINVQFYDKNLDEQNNTKKWLKSEEFLFHKNILDSQMGIAETMKALP